VNGSWSAGKRFVCVCGANEGAALIENYKELALYGLAPEQGVKLLAAHNAVVFVVASTICQGNEVFDACQFFGQLLLAEKALASLAEQNTFKLLHTFCLDT
jgi:hypothetical protein